MKKINFTFTYFISMIFIILFNLYFSTFYNTIEHFNNSGNDITITNSNSNFNYLTQVPCMSSTYKDQFKPISEF